MTYNRFFSSFLLLSFLFTITLSENVDAITLLKTLPGFTISEVGQIPFARSLSFDSKDRILYVSTMDIKNWVSDEPNVKSPIMAVVFDEIFRVKKVINVTEPLEGANGIAYRDGDLYVAFVDSVWKYRNIDKAVSEQSVDVEKVQIIGSDIMPGKKTNGWRYLRFSPDDRLYISIGSPCDAPTDDNLCNGTYEGTIISSDPEGSDIRIVLRGIRNNVGFDWDEEKNLWFTDNGRHNFPNDPEGNPPDELNKFPNNASSLHFGFPFCYGKSLNDPTFFEGPCIPTYTGSEVEFHAHSAPLGVRFYSNDKGNFRFPEPFQKNILIAQHGTTGKNELPLAGYKVTIYSPEEGKNQEVDFLTGWLGDEPISCSSDEQCPFGAFCLKSSVCSGWGRPVDIEVLTDGSVVISDDLRGTVYRVYYDEGLPWYVYLIIAVVFVVSVLSISVVSLCVASRIVERKKQYNRVAN